MIYQDISSTEDDANGKQVCIFPMFSFEKGKNGNLKTLFTPEMQMWFKKTIRTNHY